MESKVEIIPHLFRSEYSKIVAVLCKIFGLSNIQLAEDIVSDTFLLASETWGLKGIPDNPTAWLYTVSKNKTKDTLKRNQLFKHKIEGEVKQDTAKFTEFEIDLSEENITDSQLQMIFAVCHPILPAEQQVGLALRILCGFGIEEIATAFLSNKQTINKRLFRAKEKLRNENIKIEFPKSSEIDKRLENVLKTLYLLFNEGYYSSSQNTSLQKDLCYEAMRLNYLLLENKLTNQPQVNALLALMCFHASRFDARVNVNDEFVLYTEQEEDLWDKDLILRGRHYLNESSNGAELTKYHLEASIAFWHTQKKDTKEKWESILQLYNQLLQVAYSPMVALNRTYALSKARNKSVAIKEAEKIDLGNNHLYHALLAALYIDIDIKKVREHLQTALKFAKTETDKCLLTKKLEQLKISCRF